GHPRVALGRNPPLTVSATAWRVPVEATLETSGEIRLNLPAELQPPTLIAGESLWVFRGDALEPVGLPKQWRELFRGPMKLPRSRVPLFLSQELAVLEARAKWTRTLALMNSRWSRSHRASFSRSTAG